MADLDSIKRIAKTLIDAVPIEGGLVVSHPFTQSNFVYVNNSILDLTKREDYLVWRDKLYEMIDSCKNFFSLYIFVTKPYKLVFLKYTKEYMDKDLFSEVLKEAYISTEFPNKDVNVSVSELKKWFKEADKTKLMTKDELSVYEKLPDTVTIYRGVTDLKGARGLSWTLNKDTAQWFSTRFHPQQSYVLYAKIPKQKIFAYFGDRNEYEVVVDTTRLKYEVM